PDLRSGRMVEVGATVRVGLISEALTVTPYPDEWRQERVLIEIAEPTVMEPTVSDTAPADEQAAETVLYSP
ncbi:MAG: hypothetical protein NZ518_09840, partial [Dehalococcoidia bacterium]|nr:hypothetical protein [Dehalococcoidia bacterium]